jgi:hypothetical protein
MDRQKRNRAAGDVINALYDANIARLMCPTDAIEASLPVKGFPK